MHMGSNRWGRVTSANIAENVWWHSFTCENTPVRCLVLGTSELEPECRCRSFSGSRVKARLMIPHPRRHQENVCASLTEARSLCDTWSSSCGRSGANPPAIFHRSCCQHSPCSSEPPGQDAVRVLIGDVFSFDSLCDYYCDAYCPEALRCTDCDVLSCCSAHQYTVMHSYAMLSTRQK